MVKINLKRQIVLYFFCKKKYRKVFFVVDKFAIFLAPRCVVTYKQTKKMHQI